MRRVWDNIKTILSYLQMISTNLWNNVNTSKMLEEWDKF